ncbi:unnamed protein product [Rhodiola kirilowii]
MAEDPPAIETPKSDNNSNPQSNENPSPAPIANSSVPFAPVQIPPLAPSFRPVMAPPPPQFVLAQAHPNYQNPSLQPPGMSGGFPPAPGQMMQQPYQQQNPGGLRPFAPMPNGYPPPPQGTMAIPGVRYPSPYPGMVRPGYPTYPLRPPGVMGMPPMLSRPPVPGVPSVRPMILPVIRPAVVPVTPAEKPQTTVWVGKIASTVDNEFMLSLLQLCGPVKSWKRTQNPSDGTPVSFGFCEFESPEGVLRALRLLSKFNIDGQELVLNVNQSTRDYLERYVQKKTDNSKSLKENQSEVLDEKDQVVKDSSAEKVDKPADEDLKTDNDSKNDVKELEEKDSGHTATFGIVTDGDRSADQETLQKLTDMVAERLKNNPLPPPPAHLPPDGSRSSTEPPTKARDVDSDLDTNREGEEKNDETGDSNTGDQDKPETSSPDRSRRHDRNKDKDRDRERDVRREKDREFDRLERETQRERERKEKEKERKLQEAEREYKERLREWEFREKEREKMRQHEKEKEKDKERKRKKEIKADESDDDDSRKRMRRGVLEDKMRKRLREKEDDIADRLKEEEELAEAEKKAKEEQSQLKNSDALKALSNHPVSKSEKLSLIEGSNVGGMEKTENNAYEGEPYESRTDDRTARNGDNGESALASADTLPNNNGPRKLGFGLVGSGKRTAVPSVFKEEEDDDAHSDKKMKPLVPIDYSTEEIQAVQPSNSDQPSSNLVAAAEFAKRISGSNAKDKAETERDRSRRSHDRSNRDRNHNNDETHRTRDDKREKVSSREKDRESGLDKLKTTDNKKLLDAKQLIDTIPKTKEELFSFEINWTVYDKHNLHERMRPWISKKITEFLGEEEATLVDYIVSSTQEHVKASQMLELLQSILDDEAEMFVLKMWRMLIFEIKKVETGLATKPKS